MASRHEDNDRDCYGEGLSMREARACYFDRNGFGADGGYGDRWVKLRLGPLSFYLPNNKGRVRAVRYHDLHHVLTGYRTDWRGEFEISAWEVGSGCADHYMAWLLNLSAMVTGLYVGPRAIFRAFVRGRHNRNLYRWPFDDEVLACRVGELRQHLYLDRPARATLADMWLFVGSSLLGGLAGLLMLVVLILAMPVAALTTRSPPLVRLQRADGL